MTEVLTNVGPNFEGLLIMRRSQIHESVSVRLGRVALLNTLREQRNKKEEENLKTLMIIEGPQ